MPPKLRLTLDRPTADLWEQWAYKHQPWETDPERPVRLEDGLRLPFGRYGRLWLPSGHIVPPPIRGGARLFNDASSQYLEVDSAPVTAAPFTAAGWGRSDDVSVTQGLLALADSATTNNKWSLEFGGATAGDPIRWQAHSSGGTSTAVSSTGYSANTWHHACAIESASNSRSAFIDGGSRGNNTGTNSPAGVNRVSIGRFGDSTPSNYFSGDIAEAVIWNVALTAVEIALLAKAVSAFTIRPASLVFYCPIIGRYSPEIDIRGGLNLTVTGATVSNHPRIFYIPRPMTTWLIPPPPSGDGTDMPWPPTETYQATPIAVMAY